MIGELFSLFQKPYIVDAWHAAWSLAPIWIPLVFVFSYWDIWLTYKRREYLQSIKSVLLEIKIPRELMKSPLAMEMFFNTLFNPVIGNLVDVYLKGKVKTWFSLELVSIDGAVHFFIWAPEGMKNRIEAQLYAQFPNIEVHEAPDYAMGMHRDPDKRTIGWIGQMALTKADAYPIKTYIDYGLDKDPKEEYKHDPLVTLLEFLGSLKKGEQAWIQILIQAHTKEGLEQGRLFVKQDWKKGIEKEIKEFIKKNAPAKEDKVKEPTVRDLTKSQQDVVTSIERTAAKYPFDTMIRAAYIGDKDVYSASNIGGLIGSFSQFNSQSLNGFKPGFSAAFKYAWQDFHGKERARREEQLLEAYKRRSFFNTPFKNFHGKPFILTSEELATIYHFPSFTVAATPTLTRLPSKKAEAPSNLPI